MLRRYSSLINRGHHEDALDPSSYHYPGNGQNLGGQNHGLEEDRWDQQQQYESGGASGLASKMASKKKGPQIGADGKGPSSLFLLDDDNAIRKNIKWLIMWPVFEYAVLTTIIANCVVLALEEHLPGGDRTMLAMQLVRSN